MKSIKTTSESLIYICFLSILTIFILLHISDLNPGNLYFGPSAQERYNYTEEIMISQDNSWQTELSLEADTWWGMSLRLELSDKDESRNFRRTSGEITGIKKDTQSPVSEKAEELIVVTVSDISGHSPDNSNTATGTLIAEWRFSVDEIRPESDFKLALTEGCRGMSGHRLLLNIETGLEKDRAVIVHNIQPICFRISAFSVRICMMVAALAFLLLCILCAIRCFDYHKAWLILGGVLSILWVLSIPYGRVPDEESHFFRIYEITQGHITTDIIQTENELDRGRILPDNLDLETKQHMATLRDEIDHRNLTLNSAAAKWYSFPNMALYSPVSYLPQILGVWLSDLLTDRVLLIVYAGRLTGMMTALLLIYFALKLLPLKKECMFLLAMLPMVFQEMISLSADSFINAASIFLTGFLLSLIFRTKRIHAWQTAVLWCLAPIIGLCKVVYLPLMLLYFLIPTGNFGSRNKKLIHTIGPTLTSVILNFSWTIVGNIGGAASSDQIAYILHNPFEFVKIAYRTLLTFGDEVLFELMGNNMGGLNISVPELPLLVLGAVILLLATAPQKNAPRFSLKQKLIITIIWISILSMTWGSMYLGYNEVGNDLITGFQGRYLIPIAFLMLVSLENCHFERTECELRKYLYPLAGTINLYVLFTMFAEITW